MRLLILPKKLRIAVSVLFVFGLTLTGSTQTVEAVGTAATLQVTVNPATVQAGGAVSVSVTNGPANVAICVYPANQSIDDWCYGVNAYTRFLDANGAGTVSSVDTASVPGQFQIAVAVMNNNNEYVDSGKRATVQVTGNGGGSGNECDTLPAIPPQIAIGATGDAVRCAQTKLNEKMGISLPVNGDFDEPMRSYVQSFQFQRGLNCREGIIGPETWGALLDRVINQPTNCNTVPPPTQNPPPSSGGGSGGSGLNCASQGLVEKNGLCLPANPGEGGKGLVSCGSVLDCLNMIIRFLLTLAAGIAVLFIIIGGLQYMTSAGNESQAEKGKKTLIYAIIGLAAVILAYTIVTIVYNTLTRNSLI